MYIYNFSYGWYEEYSPIILMHEKKYSKKEFANMCREACKKASIFLLLNIGKRYIGLDKIHNTVGSILIVKYGFKEPEITGYNLWGGIIINSGDSERDYGDDECAKEILGEKLFNEVVKHNEKINKRLNKK